VRGCFLHSGYSRLRGIPIAPAAFQGLVAQHAKVLSRQAMSRVQVDYGIVAGLVAAEAVLGRRADWRSANDVQSKFLHEVFSPCRDEAMRLPEIEAVASRDATELNAFLERHGFKATFPDFSPSEVGSAAIVDLKGCWPRSGRPASVQTRDGAEAPAVATPIGSRVDFFRVAGHPHPVARMNTAEHDSVWMTMQEEPGDIADIGALAVRLQSGRPAQDEFEGLVFPMVDLAMEADLSWLSGLRAVDTLNQQSRVAEARQQNTLKMNEAGFRARSATSISIMLGGLRKLRPHFIDRPFLFWITRQGLSRPLFVAWLTEDCWRRPSDLGPA